MSPERRRALSRALLLIALSEATEHVGKQLEGRRPGGLVRWLLAVADPDDAACDTLGLIERALGAPNLHQAGENRSGLGVIRTKRRLLEDEKALEEWTSGRVILPLERDPGQAVQAGDDVGMLCAKPPLGDGQGALEERLSGVDVTARVEHRREPVHRLHEAGVVTPERGFANLQRATEQTLGIVVSALAQLQLSEIGETRRESQIAGAELFRFTNGGDEGLFGTSQIALAEEPSPGLVLRFPALDDLVLHGGSLDTLKTLPMVPRHLSETGILTVRGGMPAVTAVLSRR